MTDAQLCLFRDDTHIEDYNNCVSLRSIIRMIGHEKLSRRDGLHRTIGSQHAMRACALFITSALRK